MRFTFREEKNSDSRDSNHNTLPLNNLQPVWITPPPSVLPLKKWIWGETDGIRSNKEHATAAEQMAHKKQVAWLHVLGFYGWCRVRGTSDERYDPAHMKQSVTKVASELGMKGNEVSAVSFRSRHFSHLSPVWHFTQLLRAVSVALRIPMLPFVRGALCPFDCVPDRLREETKSDRVINGSMWFAICIPRPRGLGWLTVYRPDVQARRRTRHMVPSCLPISGHFWLNLSLPTSPWQPLLPSSFILDIDLAVTSPPLGTVASLGDMMKASKGRPPWLHTKQTPLWTLCLLLFSLQFKSRGGQRPAQLVVMCGSHVARAWVMLLLWSGRAERRATNIHGLK